MASLIAGLTVGLIGGMSICIVLITVANIQWVRTTNNLLKGQGSKMRLRYRGFWMTSEVVWLDKVEE